MLVDIQLFFCASVWRSQSDHLALIRSNVWVESPIYIGRLILQNCDCKLMPSSTPVMVFLLSSSCKHQTFNDSDNAKSVAGCVCKLSFVFRSVWLTPTANQSNSLSVRLSACASCLSVFGLSVRLSVCSSARLLSNWHRRRWAVREKQT